MTIRTILAGLSGGSASAGTTELACRVAAVFGAHLEALHVRMDVTGFLIGAGAEGLAAAADMRWAEEVSAAIETRAEQTRASFVTAAARHGLPLAASLAPADRGAFWREETGDAAAFLSHHARFFDLTVLGRSGRVIDEPHTDTIEETLTRSGRPVLLVPAEPPDNVGETIAVAWNGSASSVRALVAALPFLHRAKETVLITLDERGGQGVHDLQAYLRAHGIAARFCRASLMLPAAPGGELLSAAREEGADLLVLGGYGRAPWRELLFGGATRDLIGTGLLPLLLAH
ncbi:MAG TPA: universal stress protein [Acetobacteraceae bacterium]|nr:universal stress protein [Acetobacteraceae bacterium]